MNKIINTTLKLKIDKFIIVSQINNNQNSKIKLKKIIM